MDSDYEFLNHDKEFDGRKDFSQAPVVVLGSKIIAQTEAVVDVVFGKKKVNLTNKRKKRGGSLVYMEEEKYIF